MDEELAMPTAVNYAPTKKIPSDYMRINLNQKVRVKLTDVGKNHLIKRHQKIHGRHANSFPRRPIEEDEEGYSIWQIWDLMGVFGELMQYPTCAPPFETEIELCLSEFSPDKT